MILWINGTFGAGKTTTSRAIVEQDASWRIFDPEHVGYMLASNLADVGADDFQDLPPWRQLVPHALHEVRGFTGSSIVAPQTVLVEKYWTELRAGMSALGLEVVQVLLDCDETVLRQRIDADEIEADAREWRLDHLDRFREASAWMRSAADVVINTTDMSSTEVASTALGAAR